MLTNWGTLFSATQVLLLEQVTPALEITVLRLASTVTQMLSCEPVLVPYVFWYIKLYAPAEGQRNAADSWIWLPHQTPFWMLEKVAEPVSMLPPLYVIVETPSLHVTELPGMACSSSVDRHG